LRGYPPCIFREVIAMKRYQISGVEMDMLKILSDYALHLSYRQALDGKRVEEVVRGGVKQERWKPAEDHPWRRSFKLKKKAKDVTFQTGNYR
jgi:hypothetical protein